MAKIENPRKQFQFNILIPGLNPFLAQEVDTVDVEFDPVEHGDVGFLVKTAGLKKIGMLKVSKIMQADSTDTFMNDWALQIFDTRLGGGDLPSNYKKTILVEQYSNDGVTVIERFEYDGCWPQKINGISLSRKGSDNTVQSIEFCVDEVA
jgi:hypothetical protein